MVRPGEHRLVKHFPGSFTQTALEAYLREEGVDAVIIAGFQTQLWCDTTTRQARERGFGVIFASDATAARDQRLGDRVIPHAEIHERTLAVMASSFGARVLPAAEIAAILTGR
jgi:nicotinamidase-related amidase